MIPSGKRNSLRAAIFESFIFSAVLLRAAVADLPLTLTGMSKASRLAARSLESSVTRALATTVTHLAKVQLSSMFERPRSDASRNSLNSLCSKSFPISWINSSLGLQNVYCNALLTDSFRLAAANDVSCSMMIPINDSFFIFLNLQIGLRLLSLRLGRRGQYESEACVKCCC